MNAKVFFVSFAFSAAWIILSDFIVHSLFPVAAHSDIQHLKGILYVLISNLVLAWFVQREIRVLHTHTKIYFNRSIFFVASLYSITWILVTDYLVYSYFLTDSLVFQTAKGLFYVFTWSLLVAWFAKKELTLSQKLFPLLKTSQVGQFTGMMIHEVRTPMTLILYYAGQITEHSEKEVLIKSRIIKNIQSLDKTITFFHKLSRNEALDSSETSEKICLSELLNEVSQQILKGESRINFINQIPNELVLTGSYGLLSHLFMNLIKNASEYLGDLNEENLEIVTTAKVHDHQVVIRLENSGSQLTEAQMERLFTPHTTKLSEGGTGFGLLISQQIVQAHKGNLRFDMNANRPAFEISLPI